MANYVAALLKVLDECGLYNRHRELMTYAWLAQCGQLSQDMAKALLVQLHPLLMAQEAYPNLLMRAPDYEELCPNGEPDLIVGKLAEAEDILLGLFLTGNMNCIFAGRAGSGKTTGLRNVLASIEAHNREHPEEFVSTICWDRKGGDYTDFAANNPQCRHFGFEETLRIGLNAPEGVPPNVWINAVSTVFAARAGLIASSVCLANMMRFLVAAMNPEPRRDRLLWPSFELILDLAKAAPLTLFAAKPDYGKTLIQMLEGVTQASENLFQTFDGLDLERDIVRKKLCCVLDVCGLGPPWVSGLASDIHLLQLLLGRQYRYERRNRVDCALCLDEGDQYADRKSEENFPDLSPLSLLLKQGREYGLAVCLGLSAIGPTARMILTNASHYFFFAMSDGDSLREARQTLLLPPHAEGILPCLAPGECLYRGPGPWPHAMLTTLNYIPSSRYPRPETYDTHDFIPSKRLDELPHVQEAVKKLIAENRNTRLRHARTKQSDLSENARKLLDLAGIHPYRPVARLWPDIGDVSPTVQAAVRKEIEDRGLASFAEVRAGRRNQLLIEVTDNGYHYLGKKPPTRRLRGGIVHSHFSEWIRMCGVKRGYKAYTEHILPGTTHPVDVAWKVNGKLRGFEIAVACQRNLGSHLTACFLECDVVDTVTIVAAPKRIVADLRKIIDAEPALRPFAHRIQYQSIETYIKELWP